MSFAKMPVTESVGDGIKFKKRKCGVFMCNNVSGNEVSMHLLPQKHEIKRRKQWMNNLKLNPRKVCPSFVICSQHFNDSDFISKFIDS